MSKNYKELYIRIGNSSETQNVIIVGEESSLGARDANGYTPSKGAYFTPLRKKDPYTGAVGITYTHATPNIRLDTSRYSRDYDVHNFIKLCCNDIVSWDGETNEGVVRSREAFIPLYLNAEAAAKELYNRIEREIHGNGARARRILKKIMLLIFNLLLLPIKIVVSLIVFLFCSKKRTRKKAFRKIWKN